MSFGKMTETLTLLRPTVVADQKGFQHQQLTVVGKVRAYREGRHGNSAWANRAAFTKATDLFRLRVIPGIKVDESMLLENRGERFEIDSVEDVRGQGRYLEILATVVSPEGGS